MKATFLQRLAAYLVDTLIISVIISFFGLAIPQDEDLYEKLEEQANTLVEQITSSESEEIDINSYLENYETLVYEMDKASYIDNLIGLVVYIAYFVIFQYLNKGQTLGKKLLKLKIVSTNGQELRPSSIVIRALIVNSIFRMIILLASINFIEKDAYMIINTMIYNLELIIVVVIAFMILFRKDKQGLHDMITKTQVIKEGK